MKYFYLALMLSVAAQGEIYDIPLAYQDAQRIIHKKKFHGMEKAYDLNLEIPHAGHALDLILIKYYGLSPIWLDSKVPPAPRPRDYAHEPKGR